MKKEAVALCRVSSAEQRVDGNSLDSQQKHVFDFAHASLGCEIERAWIVDVSSKKGKNIKRQDLLEIRQYCKEHRHIKYFVVDKVNRLMREIKMFYWFVAELEMIGVKTLFADPKQEDLNKEDDKVSKLKLFLEIFGAEADNQERIDTTLTRMKDRILAGYYPFPIHPGYKKSLIAGLHDPDPDRFSLLQSAMLDILAGRFSVSQALEHITKQGYKTSGGRCIRIDEFRDLLCDDYYAGLITIKKWNDPKFTRITGLHKAMISVEQYEELRAIARGKKRIFERKKDNKEFPLGNIGYCECGGKLVGFYHRNGKGWRSPKYRCRMCGKQFHSDRVHASIDQKFGSIGYHHSDESEFMEALKEVWKQEELFVYQKISSLERSLDHLMAERNQIVRKIALNDDSSIDNDFKAILSETKKQIENIENEISELKDNEKDFQSFVKFSLRFLGGKMATWKQLDRDKRIKCKQLAFPGEIYVNFSEKVCTPEISPILISIGHTKRAQSALKSNMVEVRGVAPLSKRLKTHNYSKFRRG